MTPEEAYRVLGLAPPSTADQVKKAYRRAALESHPDRHQDPAAKAAHERRFREAREAYSTLIAAGFPELREEPPPEPDFAPRVAGRRFAVKDEEPVGQAEKLGIRVPWTPQAVLAWAVGLPAGALALVYFVKRLLEVLKGGAP